MTTRPRRSIHSSDPEPAARSGSVTERLRALIRFPTLGVAASAALLLAFLPVAGLAQAPNRQRDLGAIRSQIASLERQLGRIDEEREGLEAELRRTEVEVELQERQVDEAHAERRLVEEALAASEARADELESALADARLGLQQRLGSLYRQGERDLLRSFLSPETSGAALEEVRMLRLLARRDAFWVDKYRTASEALVRHRQVGSGESFGAGTGAASSASENQDAPEAGAGSDQATARGRGRARLDVDG